VRLRSVGRGQEFVLDLTAYPEAHVWLAGLFNEFRRPIDVKPPTRPESSR
jgi:hypothetical protein